MDYLTRYAFRIAITNARFIAMDDIHVTLEYKHRDTGEWKRCRLTGVEFLRRFLMQVLPKGFHKLRYYELWHPSKGAAYGVTVSVNASPVSVRVSGAPLVMMPLPSTVNV